MSASRLLILPVFPESLLRSLPSRSPKMSHWYQFQPNTMLSAFRQKSSLSIVRCERPYPVIVPRVRQRIGRLQNSNLKHSPPKQLLNCQNSLSFDRTMKVRTIKNTTSHSWIHLPPADLHKPVRLNRNCVAAHQRQLTFDTSRNARCISSRTTLTVLPFNANAAGSNRRGVCVCRCVCTTVQARRR